MPNPRIEFQRVLKAAAGNPEREALRALEALVQAAQELSRAWDHLGDPSFLEEGYPRSLPSFDDLAEELREWRNKARAGGQ